MTRAYRSFDAVIDERLARFRARREAEQAESEGVLRIFVDRSGRIAGGMAGTACGVLMFLTSVMTLPEPSGAFDEFPYFGTIPTLLLGGGWVLAVVAGVVARG